MADNMFTTGGPTRLPVFFLTAILITAVLAACSGEDKPSQPETTGAGGFLDGANGAIDDGSKVTEGGSATTGNNSDGTFDLGEPGEEMRPTFGEDSMAAGEFLWDTPDLPEGIALEINGVAVDHFVVASYLLPPWSAYASRQPLETPVAELTTSYFADPEVVSYELVRGIVLLREAEARFPELDEHELEHYRERMEGAAGTAKDSLIKRYGAVWWAAHVERKFRLQLILNEYREYAPEVTDEELYEFYDSEILANLPEPEKREHIDISFKSMEPSLRENLMKGRAVDAQEAWLNGEIIGVTVKATLPANLSKSWTITELP
jgi:hypothetical protein